MARAIRVEFEGAVYHVMARGNERRRIVRSDADRKLWLRSIAEAFGTALDSPWNVCKAGWSLAPRHFGRKPRP
jgi:hypothetical protein